MSTEEEELRAKARAKIEKLEKDAKKLRSELRSTEDFHRSAWEEYGSELCAGDMQGKEAELGKKIKEVEANIKLLHRYVAYHMISRMAETDTHCKSQMESIDNEITRQQSDKDGYQKLLDEHQVIRSLLGID